MGVLLLGASSGLGCEIDADQHMPVTIRSPAFQSNGSYRCSKVTGNIVATLPANSDLFSFQWTNQNYLCLIQSVRVWGLVTIAITTAVSFDLALFIARNYTAAPTNGVPMQGIRMNQTMRSTLTSGIVAAGSVNVQLCLTSAMTAGTRTLDASPVGRVQGNTGTLRGTQIFADPNPQPLYRRDNEDSHPIVLAQNEGIVMQNPFAGPATGTIALYVQVNWQEGATY